MPDDLITIVSVDTPDYNINSTKVWHITGRQLIEGDAGLRVIPLNPGRVNIVFQTIDTTGRLIPNAALTVTIDGTTVGPNNSGSGMFTVNAPLHGNITIVAAKPNWGMKVAITNRNIQMLQGSPQVDRSVVLDSLLPVGHDGDPRFNLHYENCTDVDFDLHVITPGGKHVYFSDRQNLNGTHAFEQGIMDFDCVYCQDPPGGNENIYWDPAARNAPQGTYKYWVKYYKNARSQSDKPTHFLLRVYRNGTKVQEHEGILYTVDQESQHYSFEYNP